MGKFQRYFASDEGSNSKDQPKAGDSAGKKDPKLKVKTVVASSQARRFNKGPRKPFNKNNKKKRQSGKKGDDPFPDKVSLPKHQKGRYDRGKGLTGAARKTIKTSIRAKQMIEKDKKISSGLEQAARAELLLLESPGGIEVEDWEHTLQLKQTDLSKHVDVATATKQFDLKLEKFGPYSFDYTLNGRYLALGGRKGHIAAFDWVTKRLLCEVNVTESVHDVKWLHNETMFAVAQKEWTYIYDSQGIEIHCLKKLDRVHSLDFLPYHFLLVAGHQSGFLSWVDVSIGKIIAQYRAKSGPPPSVLTTNPSNAVTFCGHSNGTVSLWAPTIKDPLASILCHGSPVSAIAIDSVGRLMATGAHDGTLRLWDLRNSYAPLTSSSVGIASNLSFSQRGLLSVSTGNQVLVFSEIGTRQKPYLKHTTHTQVSSLNFCPYEDVLGIGSFDGFQSILVPGAGEANFDALEKNPYQTKQQRREAEVKSLLEKIQPELISIDNSLLGEVDTETLGKSLEEKPSYIKKADIELSHRKKRKNAKIPKIKEGLRAELTVKQARVKHQQAKSQKDANAKQSVPAQPQPFENPLDRFRVQKKKK